MSLSFRTVDGIAIVSVAGVAGAADSRSGGYLFDVLVECIADGGLTLIVDLSCVHLMTHAGVRGLVVAAKMLEKMRGEMRICGAQRAVEAFLKRLGFDHLLKCDRTLEASLSRLCGGAQRDTVRRLIRRRAGSRRNAGAPPGRRCAAGAPSCRRGCRAPHLAVTGGRGKRA